ncbi:hypothetical protein CEF21_05030 [Bacillus sp. FJAT-42376]|uniref:hypothetical protein n=1 Tax=Bacillus sp. FJAT-42376 TaxID=2014076 RepID=UPI000F4FF7C5|nr:hypothetical protein [Bacillus sp. FJAT-42376]AZB41713.1 hypothetical protein CEF21_05030 [Bacillus sp. FJAT-42376]
MVNLHFDLPIPLLAACGITGFLLMMAGYRLYSKRQDAEWTNVIPVSYIGLYLALIPILDAASIVKRTSTFWDLTQVVLLSAAVMWLAFLKPKERSGKDA